ncbi:plant UBX domain-containing protein 7 [Setaria italica]|uniref:UBX domain-containing protein n=2 Tax=Setaria italica TaxID=4555 RepID=K3YZ63_SETIT|nr:plant UBX domain-containing protein 7 [Setaria italica]
MDKQMVSTFMEITACESQAYAVQHLGSCRWNLDEAINLYFNSGDGGGAGPSAVSAPVPPEEEVAMKEDDDSYDAGFGGDDGVRAPIPSCVEALYEDDAYYGNHDAPYIGFGEEPYPPPVPSFHAQALSEIEATGWGVAAKPGEIAATGWEEAETGDGGHVGAEDVDSGEFHDDAEQEDSSSSSEEDSNLDDNMSYSDNEVDDYGFEMDEDDSSYYASIEEDGTEDAGEQPRPAQPQQQQDSLHALYQPPVDLMFVGSFHDAKVRATREDRFLLVNLQTLIGAGHFQSMLHNRDLWSDEQVKNAVKESFMLFLVQKSSTSSFHYLDQCSKVCSFYRLEDDQLPAVLILDPITGQLLNKWSGPMTPDEFMEYVDAYTKEKPSTMSVPKFVKRTSAPAVAAGEQEPASSSASAAAAVEQEPAATENSKPEIPKNAAPAGASCSEQEPVPAPEAEPPAEMVDDDEPMEGEKMYKLRIRFPDGSMVPKEFGCRRRVASLFAFCRSAVRGGGEAAAEQAAFQIMRFAGRGFEAVQAGGATFEDLGLNCATVSVVFEP